MAASSTEALLGEASRLPARSVRLGQKVRLNIGAVIAGGEYACRHSGTRYIIGNPCMADDGSAELALTDVGGVPVMPAKPAAVKTAPATAGIKTGGLVSNCAARFANAPT